MKDSIAVSKISELAPELCALSQDLWDHPEVAFSEHYAAQRLKDYLKSKGFSIESPLPELPTAFVASWGKGRPVIGLLAEYDALPGFSQKTQTSEEPVTPGGAGHACGHNLMGAAHAGAAVAVKEELERRGLEGTIIYYGCPAEEVLTGKVFMARAGLFDGLDCALNFHPNVVNGIDLKRCAGINNVKFKFHGTISHAAARPYDGRSASDAAELMNVGANYLREHIGENIRFHYVTTSGGRAPNIVPNYAEVWYHIRARVREDVEDVYSRLIDVAKGAAMMTGTRVEIDLQGGCYPTLQNKVLADTVRESMEEIGAPTYTEEEKAYAAALNATCPQSPRRPYKVDPSVPIFEGIKGPFNDGGFAYNASDIGDVSHLLPTIMFGTVCSNFLSDLHSWQFAACTGHSIGQKGMLFAAKTLALSAMKLMTEPQRIRAAAEQWQETMADTRYICPIPPEVMPPVVTK